MAAQPLSGDSFYSPKRFRSSAASHLLTLGLQIVVTLLLTRFFVRELGYAAFGLIYLSLSLAKHFSAIFIDGIYLSVRRRLTIDLQRGETESANTTFNTGLFWALALFAALLLATPLLAKLLLRVTEGQEIESAKTHRLFMLIFSGACFFILRAAFQSSTYAKNKLALERMGEAAFLAAYLIFSFLLISLFGKNPVFAGCGVLLASLLSLIVAFIIHGKIAPELNVRPRAFSKTRFRELFHFSYHSVLVKSSGFLFFGTDTLIISAKLPEALGRYSLVLQWIWLLRLIVDSLAMGLSPYMTGLYSKNDLASMDLLARKAIKWLGLALALPAACVAGLAKPILNIWIGRDFPELEETAKLLQTFALSICFIQPLIPLHYIHVACDRIRVPALLSLSLSLLNVMLAFAWADWGKSGLGVVWAGILTLGFMKFLFSPFYTGKILNSKASYYVMAAIPGILLAFIFSHLNRFIFANLPWQNIYGLGATALISILLFLPLLWFALADSGEKSMMAEIFASKWKGL